MYRHLISHISGYEDIAATNADKTDNRHIDGIGCSMFKSMPPPPLPPRNDDQKQGQNSSSDGSVNKLNKHVVVEVHHQQVDADDNDQNQVSIPDLARRKTHLLPDAGPSGEINSTTTHQTGEVNKTCQIKQGVWDEQDIGLCNVLNDADSEPHNVKKMSSEIAQCPNTDSSNSTTGDNPKSGKRETPALHNDKLGIADLFITPRASNVDECWEMKHDKNVLNGSNVRETLDVGRCDKDHRPTMGTTITRPSSGYTKLNPDTMEPLNEHLTCSAKPNKGMVQPIFKRSVANTDVGSPDGDISFKNTETRNGGEGTALRIETILSAKARHHPGMAKSAPEDSETTNFDNRRGVTDDNNRRTV